MDIGDFEGQVVWDREDSGAVGSDLVALEKGRETLVTAKAKAMVAAVVAELAAVAPAAALVAVGVGG